MTRIGLPGHVAAAEHEVGVPAYDRSEQRGIVGERVLEIGVLDQHDVTGRVRGALAHRVALPPGVFVDDNYVLGRSRSGDVAARPSSCSRR